MKTQPRSFRRAFLQFTSCSGEGFQLEILPGDENGGRHEAYPEPIARFVADDDEFQWLEFFTAHGAVRLPVSQIEEAIAIAKRDVHGEAWYDDEGKPR